MAVYIDAHDPDERVHEVTLNTPPALLSTHDTVPMGVVGELDESLTLTINLTVPAKDKVAGLGVIVVVVRCNSFTKRDDMPALPE